MHVHTLNAQFTTKELLQEYKVDMMRRITRTHILFSSTLSHWIISTLYFPYQATMVNEGQLNNNNEQDLDLAMGNHAAWNQPVEYNLDDLLGTEDHHADNNNQRSDDDEDRRPESGTTPSKRAKRFSAQQVQELEA